jgi:3-methyladenine DNA glycosylase/8-oxoguanine DNA glycosylase
MRALGEPDIFPVGGREVRRVLKNSHKPFGKLDVCRAAARWRPWGAYAAMYLWVADAERIGGRTDREPAHEDRKLPWVK